MKCEIKNVSGVSIVLGSTTFSINEKIIIYDDDAQIYDPGREILKSYSIELGVYVSKGDVEFYFNDELSNNVVYYAVVNQWNDQLKGTLPYRTGKGVTAYYDSVQDTLNVYNPITKKWMFTTFQEVV